MRKRFLKFPLFLLLVLFLTLPASAAGESGRVEIANRNDADGAFSCDVKLSGGQICGDVFAVLYAESGQMKRVSEYPAVENVKVALQDVVATDYVKILWMDENFMPLASPAVLRMSGNNAAAYAQFAQDLTGLKALEPSGVSESSEPYALARLIVSADTLPDLSGYDVQTVSGPDRLHILQFKTSGEAERCEKYLNSSRSVRYAEPDLIITANGDSAGTGTPRSWGVKETGIGEYAASLLKREINRPVTVAVVDSGVDAAHPFLKDRLVSGYDFVDRDSVPQDGHGHGTHVAGTVVDCTPGMKVNIMPVRVLDNGAGGTLLDIFLGIRYAVDNGANVINLSLSLRSHSDMIEDAIQDAISKSITVVVAAGNYNGNAAFYCPAHTQECITVAAVDSALKRYERSNYGGAVDVAAPGVNVESSYPGGGFREMSGTSMAAPHVSAAAALLIGELGASQTPSQIAAAIRGAARTIPKDAGDFEWQRYDGDDFLGAGFLDMRAFIPEPESQFYAHLYADGELAFQMSRTPDPNKTLVETYPVSASAGAGEYAAWHGRRAEIRTVTFIDSIRPDSTALWFYSCENLAEIKGIENLDVSAVTDMSQMFSRCGSLKKLDLSALHTENIRNMRFMFFSCGKLAELDLTGWNTENVADMSDMFNGCAALEAVYASESFKTDSVSNGVGMFSGCTSLVGGSGTKYDSGHVDKEYARIDGDADAPGYFTDKNAPTDVYALLYDDGTMVFQYGVASKRTQNVIEMYPVDLLNGYTTYSDGRPTTPWYNMANSITQVDFADTIAPQSTAYWIHSFTNLKEITNISRLNTSNVTTMECMFRWCRSLTSLDVSGFDTSNVSSMRSMFDGCHALTSLDVRSFDTSCVTDMSQMFNWCENLKSLDLSGLDTSNVSNMCGMFYSCHALTSLDVSSFDTSCVTDMSQMFSCCENLKSLDVSGFDTSNVSSMRGMFDSCHALTALDVSGFDTSCVTDMSQMFNWCARLMTLNLSSFDTSNVTNMDSMFSDCGRLTSLDVSGFDTSNVSSMRGMFDSCHALTSLDVSSFDTSRVTDTSYMFYECSSLTTLELSRFDTSCATNMSAMFYHCSSLTTLNLSSFNTSCVTDMSHMFYECYALTSLDVSSFDTYCVKTMHDMFAYCYGLTSLDVSSFDTSCVTDMGYMFYYCPGLKTIYASAKFVTTNVLDSNNMFANSWYIVGGQGTKRGPNDKTYARIDGGADAPGYFTLKDETANLSAEELFHLGEDYFDGKNGKSKDYKKSVYYYTKSAEKGNMYALNDLGYIYQHGYGVAVVTIRRFSFIHRPPKWAIPTR